MPRRRVMLVDDHPGFLVAARALLAHQGLDIVADAGSGEEALELASQVRPDLVLLDLRLPGVSGVDVAVVLSRRPDPPDVILISSDAEAADDPDVIGAPVRGFIAKERLSSAAIAEVLGCAP